MSSSDLPVIINGQVCWRRIQIHLLRMTMVNSELLSFWKNHAFCYVSKDDNRVHTESQKQRIVSFIVAEAMCKSIKAKVDFCHGCKSLAFIPD